MNRNEQYTEGISFLEEVTEKLREKIEKLAMRIIQTQPPYSLFIRDFADKIIICACRRRYESSIRAATS